MKQLHKLIHVLRVEELPARRPVERELALIKVGVGGGERAEVLEIVEIFRAKVVDVDGESLIVEVTGSPDKVRALEALLEPYGIVELARTGRIALGSAGAGLKAPACIQSRSPDRRTRLQPSALRRDIDMASKDLLRQRRIARGL